MVQQTEQFQIIDETPSEQVAIEEKVLAEQPVIESVAPETPESLAEPMPVAMQAPIPQATKPATTEPKPRIYSEDEVRRMQSSWDRQIAQERATANEHQARLQQFDFNAQVETRLRLDERKLELALGEDEARKIVRDPDNIAQVSRGIQIEHRARVLEEQQAVANREAEFQAKTMTAKFLAQEHGIPVDKIRFLMAVDAPETMLELARDMGGRVKAAASVRATVPVETSRTSLESGISGTSSPESTERMADRLNNKPSWEWTPKEHEFMRTGRIS